VARRVGVALAIGVVADAVAKGDGVEVIGAVGDPIVGLAVDDIAGNVAKVVAVLLAAAVERACSVPSFALSQ